MATFPRDKLFRLASSRINAYRAISEGAQIPVNQHELTQEDQTYRFRYVVRVTTYNEETDETINRFVSLTDDKRFTKGEILGRAQDMVMESPIAAQEDFTGADIVFALRKS
jgi:hypothetical protein